MIPIILLVGALNGFLPRWWPLAGIAAIGLVGVILFASDDLINSPIDALGVFLFGSANAAAGTFISWLLKRLFASLAAEQRDPESQ